MRTIEWNGGSRVRKRHQSRQSGGREDGEISENGKRFWWSYVSWQHFSHHENKRQCTQQILGTVRLEANTLYDQICNSQRFLHVVERQGAREGCTGKERWWQTERVTGKNTLFIMIEHIPWAITAYRRKCPSFTGTRCSSTSGKSGEWLWPPSPISSSTSASTNWMIPVCFSTNS